jgi:GxxExxY protein
MTEDEIGGHLVNAAFNVHSFLGPGLLESTYEKCLAFEALDKGLSISTQVPLPVIFKGNKLECGYRIDLLAENRVIVEVKAVEELNNVHLAQLLTYLKLSGLKLGYLFNFNVSGFHKGIRRVVL